MIIPETIPKMLFERVDSFGNRPLLMYKEGDRYRPLTWREFGRAVRETAGGLIRLGVGEGDRVAIMAKNGPRWAIADFAIIAAGAVTVPLYHTSSRVEAERIIRKSGTRIAFAGRSDTADMLLSCSPALEHIISLDGPAAEDGAGTCRIGFEALRSLGRKRPGTGEVLARRMGAMEPGDCATIIYTSGTTGDPKGVMLSHRNILSNAAAGLKAQPVGPDDVFLSFLPLSHVFERTVGQFLAIMAGATIAYAESVRGVSDNLRDVHPTIMLGVPRFYEKLHARVMGGVERASGLRKVLFSWAMDAGARARRLRDSGRTPGLLGRMEHALADYLVFRRLRRRLGGRLRFFVSGGAPLSAAIAEFFLNAGVEILEGYGLTEASPVIAVNRLGRVRPGTVGQPLPGVEVRITGEGEIAVRGSSVMLGYYRDPAATADAIVEGWLLTGDIGEMDGDGYLRITDRKKEVIVTSGGKKVSPQYIETIVIADPLISQCMIYGEGKKYITAIVVPEFDRLRIDLPSGIPASRTDRELVRDEEVVAFLLGRIRGRMSELASFERVQKILVINEPFTESNGLLTPTLKVRRKAVVARYGRDLDALYAGGPKEGDPALAAASL